MNCILSKMWVLTRLNLSASFQLGGKHNTCLTIRETM
jgi:hypothetical protein